MGFDALRDALTRRRPLAGLIQHSDRGSPYASVEYRAELDRFGIVASMSRKGDCWDNAVAESFFSTLKTELGADRIYESRDEATMIIGAYIDGFYNATRRHSHLGYLSPIEFEFRNQVAAAAASSDPSVPTSRETVFLYMFVLMGGEWFPKHTQAIPGSWL